MFNTNFNAITNTINRIKKEITTQGFRVGEKLLGIAWDKTLEAFWTAIDTGLMVSSTLILIDITDGPYPILHLINEAQDPDTKVFYPRRVEFGIGQRPQPWFFRAILFAIANGKQPMVTAANSLLRTAVYG